MADNQSGPIVFLGGLLLLITSILEFILGNTFPCVVFGTIGEAQLRSRSRSDIMKDYSTKLCQQEDFGLRLLPP